MKLWRIFLSLLLVLVIHCIQLHVILFSLKSATYKKIINVLITITSVCYDPLIFWRASEASETLLGVTQLKIGDICLYMCLDVRKVFLYFDPRIFVLVLWSTPFQTSLNRILQFIDQYPYHPRN